MERPNPFYRRSRISAKKFRQLLRLFALDLTATDVAQLTSLTRKSVTVIFLKIRKRLAEECERASPLSSGEDEVDESYFGARRVRGKRGRGARGKTIVFGLLKRDGKVYTEIVPDGKKATLQAIMRGRIALDAVINSDGWRGYNGLVDVGYAKHPQSVKTVIAKLEEELNLAIHPDTLKRFLKKWLPLLPFPQEPQVAASGSGQSRERASSKASPALVFGRAH